MVAKTVALVQYVKLLQDKTTEHFAKHYPSLDVPEYQVASGKKFHKIVRVEKDGHQSVHSFVDQADNLYKAASWAAPAKGIRYNLNTDMPKLREVIDPFGSYLYKRGV